MRILCVFATVLCITAYQNVLADPIEIAPAAGCPAVTVTTRVPVDGDCSRFMLCEPDGSFMILPCRSTEPHFNRCTQACVNDVSVCQLTSCDGTTASPGVTTTTAAPPAPEDTTTAAGATTVPTTVATPPAGGTTTRFNPPTAPVVITCPGDDPPCENLPADCDCAARYRCWDRQQCSCNEEVVCPVDRATCESDTEFCECAGKCDCSEEEGVDECLCNDEKQCRFEESLCASKCGCANNCDCDEETPKTCVCNEECACIEPPNVCPFPPAECASRCGCDKRCENTCNGNFCVCDTTIGCTRNFFLDFLKY